MKTYTLEELRAKSKLTKADIAENDAWAAQETAKIRLRELREKLGYTQVELAKAANMSQAELSKMERRPDMLVSTVERLVSALGGKLEVTAVVKGKRTRLL